MSALVSDLMNCPDAETLADLAQTPGNLERRAAIASFDEALRHLPAKPDEEEFKIQTEALAGRGEGNLRVGNFALAGPDFTRLFVDAEKLKRPDLVLRAQLGTGRVAAEQGDHARAIRILRDAIPALVKSKTPTTFTLGEAQLALALSQWESGDRARARITAREAEANLARSIDEAQNHPATTRLVPFRRARLATAERWRAAHP